MTPGTSRNEQWATALFRPLLDEINISSIPIPPNQLPIIRLSQFEQLRKLGLQNCVLIVRRRAFKSTVNGYYTFSFSMIDDQPIFFVSIFLNEQLFTSETPAQKIKRRKILVHEFTHCVAAFLLVEKIMENKGLKEKLASDLVTHTKLNYQNHYQSLMVQFGSDPIPIANAFGIFPDEHFRLANVKFYGSFATLYKNLMLDFSIFEKYFTSQYREQFKQHIQKGSIESALTVLTNVCHELVSHEYIPADFIKIRMREQLLQYYYLEAIKESL